MPSFASALETTLHKALEAAATRRHEYATLEHLLLALVDDEHASKVMDGCNVYLEELKATVAHYLDTELSALKVAAFSSTAAWLAGIFGIIPALSFLGILALYSFFLFWVGLPKLMRAPGDKAIGYVATTVVAAIILFYVIGAVAAQLMPAPSMPSISITG